MYTLNKMSLELQSQINSILRIMRISLDKLRLSLILPNIFENLTYARQRLKGNDFENCIDLIEKYFKQKVFLNENLYICMYIHIYI